MSDFSAIHRCRDITDEDIGAAIEAREDTRALLDRVVAIAKPREAGARVLLVFARMATSACDWLDGSLRLELVRHGDLTAIDSFAAIGPGLKERVFPRLTLNVPFVEFITAIDKFPGAIAPLVIDGRSDERLALVASEAARAAPRDHAPRALHVPTPAALDVVDLPTVQPDSTGDAPELPMPAAAAPAKPFVAQRPLAKLKLRRAPALGHTISEEIAPKPAGDRRRDSTGEHPVFKHPEPDPAHAGGDRRSDAPKRADEDR